VTAAQFDAGHLADEELLGLVAKTKVHRDAALTARYPAGIPNRLVIRTGDGRTVTREVEFPRGHARNPMTDSEVEAKFRRLADGVLPAARQTELLEKVWGLDGAVTAADLMRPVA
jgi:2-methylcitrate dehydratase